MAKLYGHLMLAAYRERYGMHLSSGIAFNHESPRRPPEFVTRKVTRAAAAIKLGLQDELRSATSPRPATGATRATSCRRCGSCSSRSAGDDYVIATGRSRSVGELVATAFAHVGLTPGDHVVVDPELVRPPDPVPLVGDPPTRASASAGCRGRRSPT